MLADAKPSCNLWTPSCEDGGRRAERDRLGAKLRETDGGWREEEEVETNYPATFISPSSG